MRSNPERLAIRTKLLEVYAKRRDTKGFELLATQLFALTRGEGEDWAKAQELGAQIDPDNPLYQRRRRAGAAARGRGRWSSRWARARCRSRSCRSPSQFGSSSVADSAHPRQRLRQHRPRPRQPRRRRALAAGSARRHRSRFRRGRRRRLDVQLDDLKMPLRRQRGGQAAPATRATSRSPFDLSGISLDLDQPVRHGCRRQSTRRCAE